MIQYVYIPPAPYECPGFSTVGQYLVFSSFSFCHSHKYAEVLHCDFICIYLAIWWLRQLSTFLYVYQSFGFLFSNIIGVNIVRGWARFGFVIANITFTGPQISNFFFHGMLLPYTLCGPWRAENLFSLFPKPCFQQPFTTEGCAFWPSPSSRLLTLLFSALGFLSEWETVLGDGWAFMAVWN